MKLSSGRVNVGNRCEVLIIGTGVPHVARGPFKMTTAYQGEIMHSNIGELPEVRFLTSGDVSDADREAATDAVQAALSEAPEVVTAIQVTLSVVDDPSLPRPALAQAVVDVNGRRLRAQAAAPDLSESIQLLRDRLALRAAYLRAG
ncbi:hypothetical protein ACGFNU_43530 [Spirillospora sp. NPDC048911]|uniref:hypothetical protein n=1 Tax=Spirillospora sp. NPDC048911 TaxID=3364527 RepID=UPI0037101BF2